MDTEMTRSRNSSYPIAACVALATFIAYLPALRNDFVYWDDNLYIFENPHIRSLDAAFFRWAFLDFHVSNWHPLSWISHAVDYALWGLNPLGHHLTNIVLHAANTAIVVLLTVKLLKIAMERSASNAPGSNITDRGVLIAAVVAGVLFGIHPVHVESVAWIAERKDLLCALFFLLSILTYTSDAAAGHSGENPSHAYPRLPGRNYLMALGFFILALMCKPMAVSLPVVLLILDWYPLNRIRSINTFRIAAVSKLPFIALAVASSFLTIAAQRAGGAILSVEEIPLSIRIPVAAKSLLAYLGKMLLPLNLMPLYPYPKGVALLSFEYVSALILVAGITAACATLARKQKFWLSAWGYYVVTLVPVLGFVQVGGQSMADRYTYLPSLGPFLALGLCVAWISQRVADKGRNRSVRIVCGTAASLVVFSLLYLTFQQIHIWRDSITLWSYVIDKGPEKISLAYSQRGTVFGKKGLADRAIADLEMAIALNPNNFDAYMNLGVAFEKSGRFDKARENIDKAIRVKPFSRDAYIYRGVLNEETGQMDQAIADYTMAITLDPYYAETYNNRGTSFGKMGQMDNAISDYSEAIRIDPRHVDARSNRGIAYTLIGRYDRALEDFNQSILLGPEDPMTYYNRGAFHRRTGKNELAIADFKKACDLGNQQACEALVQMKRGLNSR